MTTNLPQRLTLLGVPALVAAGLLLSVMAPAAPRTPAVLKDRHISHKAPAASPATYECPACHERVSAAQAKSQHMLCACCEEKLIPIKAIGTNAKNAR